MNHSGMEREILDLLAKSKAGLSLSQIARELGMTSEEKSLLRRNIKRMENQDLILKLRKRYFIRPRSNITQGRFTSSARGFGFVIPEEEHLSDIYVPEQFAGGAFHGDRVEVRFKERGKKGRPEGKVVRILKKGRESVLGLCRVQSGQVFIRIFTAVSPQEIPIKCEEDRVPKSGDVVRVRRDTLCLEEILGALDEPGVDTRIVIDRYFLEEHFSAAALVESEKIRNSVTSQQKKGRIDHTGWQTFTIDGENAQDFDDAVSIKSLPGGKYLLGVHIADVAEYVKAGTAVDEDARTRGTSVYFPDRTLPMLPEKLSNVVCSLRPKEEKLTVSVVMKIDREGQVLDVDIHPSWIRTTERMTYDSVLKIIEGAEEERKKFPSQVQDLLHMKDLAGILRKKRLAEGGLDFDMAEPELFYDKGSLCSVGSSSATEAHRIIEEFMVSANVAVARFLLSKDIPMIFRVHPKPMQNDLNNLRQMLEHFGIDLPKAKKIDSKDLQSVLEKVRETPEEKFVTLRVLRSLSLAFYSEENCGHYGLAKDEYTHFTSPIRRYPDLIVHRILKGILEEGKIERAELTAVARRCSEQERAAEEAERDLVEWRIYRFLKEKLGDEFEGIIVDFTKAGLIVELDDYFVGGLVPYSDLGGDYFYQKTERVLIGRKTGKSFQLGSRIRVLLVSVDPVIKRMNLMVSS